MNIPQIIEKNKKLKTLFEEVSSEYLVQFKKGTGDTWGSHIEKKKKKNRAIVSWVNTKEPEAAIAHELLHFKTQIKGYKRIRLGLSLDNEILKGENGFLKIICDAIDNEIQHHKMYNEYMSLGLKPEAFFTDSDIGTEARIKEYLKEENSDFVFLFVQYLTLIAPGGHISKENKELLKKEFRNQANGQFKDKFDQIDKIINMYINDDNYDAEKYIIDLINLLEAGRIWIGYGDGSEFPKNGFFVGTSFDLNDIKLAFNK